MRLVRRLRWLRAVTVTVTEAGAVAIGAATVEVAVTAAVIGDAFLRVMKVAVGADSAADHQHHSHNHSRSLGISLQCKPNHRHVQMISHATADRAEDQSLHLTVGKWAIGAAVAAVTPLRAFSKTMNRIGAAAGTAAWSDLLPLWLLPPKNPEMCIVAEAVAA
jgi:hypothetical protein